MLLSIFGVVGRMRLWEEVVLTFTEELLQEG